MKKALLAAVAALAFLVAAVAAASHSSAAPGSPSATAQQQGFAMPPRVLAQFGHIRALVRKGSRYELRFDPAEHLGGVTANRAAAADGVISPGESVPNDYYVVDESHRLYTYLVPAGVPVTIVTNGLPGGLRSTRVTVAELAAILKGGRPRQLRVMERRFPFWIRIATDTVRSIDQQYQP